MTATDSVKVLEKTTPQLRAQLVDEAANPLSKGDVTSITVSLYDQATDGAINSRTDVSLLDVNGGALAADLTITGATAANPVVVTAASHGLRTGDEVYITGVGGMTELNGRKFDIVVLDANRFELRREDGRDHTAYTSGGTIYAGLFTWDMAEADNAIIGSTTIGEYERHVVELSFGYSTSGKGRFELYVDVRQLSKVS